MQEGLDGTGPSISHAVLYYIRNKAAVEIDGNDFNPEAFDGCLKGLLGWGAGIVEKRILDHLYQKLDVHTKIESGFAFAEELEKVRNLFGSSEVPVEKVDVESENSHRSTRKALLVNSKGKTL